MKGTVRQLWFGHLAFQKPSGLHLDVVLEALFRGAVLSLFAVAGLAVCDRAELRKEGGGYERAKGA